MDEAEIWERRGAALHTSQQKHFFAARLLSVALALMGAYSAPLYMSFQCGHTS